MRRLPSSSGEQTEAALDERLAHLGSRQRALLEQRMRNGACSGHGLVAEALAQLGVTHVYGVPGQPVYDTFGACARQGIRLIGTRHQHPAGLMAAAHNYLDGRLSAATIVSTGVPAANAVSAAAVANDNCWPLVILAGAAPLAADGTGYFMALDALEVYRPVTKWVTRVRETREIPALVAKAFSVASSGRPGAVLVELPEDTLSGSAFGAGSLPVPSAAPPGPEPDPVVLRQVVDVLLSAKRPLLVVGKGARWTAAIDGLKELVDGLALPFITSPMGRGTIPDDHALCMNAVSWVAQSQADVVLLLGARLDWVFRYGQQLAPDAMVIHVDVHAAEFGRNRKIEFGVHSDAGRFLSALLREIEPGRRSVAKALRDCAWLARLRVQRRQTQARRDALAGKADTPVSPLRLAAEVRDALPADAITIFDSNLTMAACQWMIPARLPASRLTPGTSGCMGVGIPYAIAAKLLHPSRPVVAICGDFAFGLSVMELETAVRHQVPVVIVVANNDGNGGSLRHKMHFSGATAEPVSMFQPGLRYDKLVEALGGHGEHVDRAGDIGPALRRAIASKRPACIDVAVDPDAPFPRD